MGTEFRPHGPHSPDHTLEVAAAMSEAMRTLNYATADPHGLDYPSHVYDLLGTLAAVPAGLPQTLAQSSRWLDREIAADRVRENPAFGPHGGDADAAAKHMTGHLQEAARAADELHRHLAKAQAAITGLEARPEGRG